jgi:prepilin signal peptidase PulO-like enzyme (type II secretory pathway)
MGGGVVSKSFWLPLMASFGTMILLYIIGFIADIDFLIFKISLSDTEIALLPIAVGMLVGVISERIIKSKSQ